MWATLIHWKKSPELGSLKKISNSWRCFLGGSMKTYWPISVLSGFQRWAAATCSQHQASTTTASPAIDKSTNKGALIEAASLQETIRNQALWFSSGPLMLLRLPIANQPSLSCPQLSKDRPFRKPPTLSSMSIIQAISKHSPKCHNLWRISTRLNYWTQAYTPHRILPLLWAKTWQSWCHQASKPSTSSTLSSRKTHKK